MLTQSYMPKEEFISFWNIFISYIHVINMLTYGSYGGIMILSEVYHLRFPKVYLFVILRSTQLFDEGMCNVYLLTDATIARANTSA